MNTIYLTLLLVAVFGPYFIQGASLNETDSTTNTPSRNVAETQNLNDEQANLLKQFHAEISKIPNLTDDYYLLSDAFAIGLLNRNKWNINAASKTFKRILLWRKSNKIDILGQEESDPKMLELFPYRLTAITRNGCPVLEMDLGKWLVPDYMESQEFVRDALESFSKFGTQMFEKTRLSVRNTEQCDQAIYLVDTTGFSSKNYAEANSLSASVRYSTTSDQYYPSLFKKIFLINGSPEFLNFMKTLLPYLGETGKYISIYSEEEKDQARKSIYKYVDPEQLTENYLGVKKSV